MSGGGGGGIAERASSAALRARLSETKDASQAVRCFRSSAILFSSDDIVCLSSCLAVTNPCNLKIMYRIINIE